MYLGWLKNGPFALVRISAGCGSYPFIQSLRDINPCRLVEVQWQVKLFVNYKADRWENPNPLDTVGICTSTVPRCSTSVYGL